MSETDLKKEILTEISTDYAEGHTVRAFDRLCWFCKGLLSQVKELEDKIEFLYQQVKGESK